MKHLLLAIFLAFTTFLAAPAMADHGYDRNSYDHYVSHRAKLDRHLDRKGELIQHRFEHKAMHAEARGKYHKADRMRAKGERINRHLNRKGNRIHTRHDPHDHHNYQRRHLEENRRHYYPRTRVVYRDYNPYNSYFGLSFHQPGLSIGWGWFD